jgi:ABC-type transporter Mla subunit MlaD
MKTKKLAVQPISPAAAAALKAGPVEQPFVPTNWVDAVADLSDQTRLVVGHQQAKIQALAGELADARGVAAASGRAHAELVDRFDALVNLVGTLSTTIETQAATIAELTATVNAVPDSITAAVAPHQKTVAELVTSRDTCDHRVTAMTGEIVTLTQRVDNFRTLVDVVQGQGESIDRARTVLDEYGRRIDGAVEVLAGHGVTLGEHLDALDDLRGVVVAASSAAAVQVERVDDLGTLAQSLRSDLQATVHALGAETAARAAAVAAVAQSVDDLSETASEQDGELAGRLAAVDQHFAAAAGKLESAVERVGAVENRVIELQRIAMEHVENIEADGVRIERVEETVIGFVAKVKAIADEIAAVKTGAASIEETANTTADMLRRVNVMLGEMPSAMMVDQDGELVRFSRSGDVTKLGKVVAHGRDGTNAADIVAVKLDGDRIVFTRSDRTEFGCSIAALIQPAPATTPPAPEIDATLLGYLSKDPATRDVQIRDMVTMRAAKKSYKLIAEKYKISERQVVRLIKGHNNE